MRQTDWEPLATGNEEQRPSWGSQEGAYQAAGFTCGLGIAFIVGCLVAMGPVGWVILVIGFLMFNNRVPGA